MTDMNEMADLKIRLERLERTAKEQAELVAKQAITIAEQGDKLAEHNFKLELLRITLTEFMKKTDKGIEVVSEAVLKIMLQDAAAKLKEKLGDKFPDLFAEAPATPEPSRVRAAVGAGLFEGDASSRRF